MEFMKICFLLFTSLLLLFPQQDRAKAFSVTVVLAEEEFAIVAVPLVTLYNYCVRILWEGCFNRGRKWKALVFAMWTYGNLGADGGIISLKKENGKWNVIDYVITIVS